jgi:hypothetical protein
MALLTKQNLIDAFTQLGALAQVNAETVELLLLGGSVMVFVFETRPSTRDVDVVILSPNPVDRVRTFAHEVAAQRNWPDDWLNDAAKGFLIGAATGPIIFSSPGIVVRRPATEQLLAMKLSAWRDDVDIADAKRLLQELHGAYDDVWKIVSPYLQPGRELKSKYAFDDLWEAIHGPN